MKKGQRNWDYAHADKNWPVVHAFIPGGQTYNEYPILKQKMADIQQVESNNHLRGGVVNLYNPIDTSWLIAMQKLGYRYACVWFDGVWADTEDFNVALLNEIDRINESAEKDWFVAGEIKLYEENGYPYFTRSLMVIHLTNWYENGEPNPYIEPSELPAYRTIDKSLDWEDSLFGLYAVRTDDEARSLYQKKDANLTDYGNSWIAWSLRRRLTVPGLSSDLMEHCSNTRLHLGTEEIEKGLQGLDYDADKISYQARRAISVMDRSSPIYFVNTEWSKPEIVEQLEGTTFNQYVGPCAGFKLLYYAYKYGFNSDTRFVFYDFDKDSVQFKQDMFDTWDGKDYESWVDAWCEANPGKNHDLQYLVKERWPGVIDMFGGTSDWLSFWNEIKKCDVKIMQADLVNGSSTIINELSPVRTLMWTSNIYSYILAKMTAKPFALEQSFISLITKLNELPDSWIVGTDINDNELMCPSRAVTSVGENNNLGFE